MSQQTLVFEVYATAKKGSCRHPFTQVVFSSTVSRKLRIFNKHQILTGWPGGMQSVSGNESSGLCQSCHTSLI